MANHDRSECLEDVIAENLRVPSLIDALYFAIRDQILTGNTPGGTPLTEMEIATRYQVARPTAKAAMERLVHDGLLRRASNKTARVPILEPDDIRDLYDTRLLLEREVMSALARKKLVPDDARRTVQDLRDLAESPVLTKVVETDMAFHRALVATLESPRLTRLYASLAGEVHLCMAQVQALHLLHPSRIADEHASILEAIDDGNEQQAIERMTDHLARARERLLDHFVAGVSS